MFTKRSFTFVYEINYLIVRMMSLKIFDKISDKIFGIGLFIVLIGLIICIVWNFKQNQKLIELYSFEKTKYDLKAQDRMDCKALKKILRPDLGAGIVIDVVPNSCFDGLPHTLDDKTIVIPIDLYEKGGKELNHILDHELIHIMQRRNIIDWKHLYLMYKWKIYDKKNFINANKVPNHLYERMRYNPDICDYKYAVWNNRYLFLCCYNDINNPQIRETELIIYDLIEQKNLKKGTYPPDYYDWMKTNQADHPHEIFAEYLSDPKNMKNSNLIYGVQKFYETQKKKLFVN